MKYLVMFNFLVSLSLVGYLIYKYFPFYFETNKTFWCKKTYSIGLWVRISGNRFSGGRSKNIFVLHFRNETKLNKWDKEMFHSGKYMNYRKGGKK